MRMKGCMRKLVLLLDETTRKIGYKLNLTTTLSRTIVAKISLHFLLDNVNGSDPLVKMFNA